MSDLSLVTGAAGFIGSHLVERLLARGGRVRALVRYSSSGHIGWLRALAGHERLEIMRGDIRDARQMRETVEGCRTVYHLAALIGIPYSYSAPASYVETNTVGTMNMLEAARDVGGVRVVSTSTSEVYGTALCTPIDEEHPLQAQSPYAATKIGADQLALSYHRSFGLEVAIARPFNTYGPRQSARAIIPTVVSQVLTADRIRVGNLSPVRDFLFVQDTADGMIAIATEAGCVGTVTNLATGRAVTIGELVERVQRLTGRALPVEVVEERKRPVTSEVFELLGDARKAQRLTGWKPCVELDEGLGRVIDWMRDNPQAADGREYVT